MYLDKTYRCTDREIKKKPIVQRILVLDVRQLFDVSHYFWHLCVGRER